jgi:hemolysin activation/secretion protein
MPNGKYKLILAVSLLAVATTSFALEDIQQLQKRIEKKPVEPKATIKPLFPEIQQPLPPEQADKIRFVLKKIELVGNTVYSQEQLSPLYEPLLNKEVSLTDIYVLMNKITAKYGNDGYTLSTAYLPVGEIIKSDGIVKIGIREAYIDNVIIEGNFQDKLGIFNKYKEKILSERPISTKTLSKYLLLANDLPGFSVTSSLEASKENFNASTLIIKAQEKKYSGFVSFDNRGTQNFGPFQSTVGVSLNNPLGILSKTDFLYANAGINEMNYYSLNHAQLLNSEGTTFKASSAHIESEPGSEILRSIQQKSQSFSFSVGLEQPFIRSREMNLTAYSKFDFKDTEGLSLGAKVSNDKIRVFRLGANFDYADPFSAINQAIFEYSRGMDVLGSISQDSPLKTRADGVINFDKMTLSLIRTQNLGIIHPDLSQFGLKVAFEGQYSENALLSGEECGVGGIQYGRGYDSSEILGDSCVTVNVEPQYTMSMDGNPVIKNIQLYGFWDTGEAINRNASASNPRSQTLSSAGGGFRLFLHQNVTSYFEVAQPLDRVVISEGNKDTRFFANVSISF